MLLLFDIFLELSYILSCLQLTWQVLDALQFLHHRGIVHLNIQPDNVIMCSRRRFDVKLIDFGQAHNITSAEGVKVEKVGTTEFMGRFFCIVTNRRKCALYNFAVQLLSWQFLYKFHFELQHFRMVDLFYRLRVCLNMCLVIFLFLILLKF